VTSIPPPPRQRQSLALVAFLGGFAAYGLAHMPDSFPDWATFLLGAVFTGTVSVAWLYQRKPGSPD
jgi:hypothetical protein